MFLVDDHPVVRVGLRLMLGRQPGLEIVGEAVGLAEARQQLPAAKPHVVLVDIALQDGDGLDLIGWIRQSLPDCRCLVLTMYDDDLLLGPAISAGAHGFLTKTVDEAGLVTAIRKLAAGELAFRDARAGAAAAALDPSAHATAHPERPLTKRELQVFRMMGEGRGPREIAASLTISTKTVEAYQARLREKLGLESTLEVRRRASLWVAGRSRLAGENLASRGA